MPGTWAAHTTVNSVQKVQQIPWFKYLEIVIKRNLRGKKLNSKWIKELNLKDINSLSFFFKLKGNAVVYLTFLMIGKDFLSTKTVEESQRKVIRVDTKNFGATLC